MEAAGQCPQSPTDAGNGDWELLRRNILELTKSEDTGPGLDDQVKQEPLGSKIFKMWFSGVSSVLQSSNLQ